MYRDISRSVYTQEIDTRKIIPRLTIYIPRIFANWNPLYLLDKVSTEKEKFREFVVAIFGFRSFIMLASLISLVLVIPKLLSRSMLLVFFFFKASVSHVEIDSCPFYYSNDRSVRRKRSQRFDNPSSEIYLRQISSINFEHNVKRPTRYDTSHVVYS